MAPLANRRLRHWAMEGLRLKGIANSSTYVNRLDDDLDAADRNGWIQLLLFLVETRQEVHLSPCAMLTWALGFSNIDPIAADIDPVHFRWAGKLVESPQAHIPEDSFDDTVNTVALDRPFPIWSGMMRDYQLQAVAQPWSAWSRRTRGLVIYRSQALARLVEQGVTTPTSARRFLRERPLTSAGALDCSLGTVRALCQRESLERIACARSSVPRTPSNA